MVYLIASDIHGSATSARLLLEKFEQLGAKKLLLLGDFLYHGPRNNLPGGHDCNETAELLNAYADKIVAVRGNCDAEVDQAMLKFPIMSDSAMVEADDLLMLMTHGHRWSISNPTPFGGYNVMLSGHTHIPLAKEQDGVVYVNPGSVALPRAGYEPSYCIFEGGVFDILTFNGEKLMSIRTEK